MDQNLDLWRTLEPGDRVRFVRPPTLEGFVHAETQAVYDRLVADQQVLTVDHLETIDGISYPWSAWFEVAGIEGTHTLMLNDDGLERVG